MPRVANMGTCPECQGAFRRFRREGGRMQIYCSVKCRMRASRRNRARIITCTWCHKEVLRPPSNQRAKNHFCSPTCHGKWMSENLRGSNHPNWKGDGVRGIMNIIRHRLQADHRWATWSKTVLANAHGLCDRCGNQAEEAHHKREVAELLALILDPANGEALCSSCHHEHHSPN